MPPLCRGTLVSALAVEGNQQVVAEHILGVVGTRVGEPLSKEQLQTDVEAIYGLGFLLRGHQSAERRRRSGGDLRRRENPVVEQITFTGNNIYTDEDLLKVVFTSPGTVFNRVFFRNDLDRIQEKYHKDGYVMVKIADVQMEGGLIDVQIVEPKGREHHHPGKQEDQNKRHRQGDQTEEGRSIQRHHTAPFSE